jgi:16S rRNA C967 or C1407 C5-methylase (RsmB/RsmF family)
MHLPSSFLESLRGLPGYDAQGFASAHHAAPVVSVRNHPLRAVSWPGAAHVPWHPQGWILAERPRFILDPLWHAGAYYVQEASSMLLQCALDKMQLPQVPVVLDACAAPGGKSTLLQSYFMDAALVWSNEVVKTRVGSLVQNASRWGFGNRVVSQLDPARLGQVADWADAVVVDAPCSGSGLFRKEPSWQSGWTLETVTHCAARQRRILADLLPALKPGGWLVYATCSYAWEENEAVVDALVEEHGLESVPLDVDAHWGVVESISPKQAFGYRCWPHWVQGEGFFLALLRKPDGPTSSGRLRRVEGRLQAVSAGARSVVGAQVAGLDGYALRMFEDQLLAVPQTHAEVAERLAAVLPVRTFGLCLGSMDAKQRLLPHQDLATAATLRFASPTLNLTLENALEVLRKGSPTEGDSPNGWVLAAYNGLGLTWLKRIQNRWNNYLPGAWRILQQLPDLPSENAFEELP